MEFLVARRCAASVSTLFKAVKSECSLGALGHWGRALVGGVRAPGFAAVGAIGVTLVCWGLYADQWFAGVASLGIGGVQDVSRDCEQHYYESVVTHDFGKMW